jgi:signal transduction histidine kinase
MTKESDQNIDKQEAMLIAGICEEKTPAHSVLPQLDIAQEKLNLLNQQLNSHFGNSFETVCDKNCLKLSIILASMADGVIVVNQQGDIEIANEMAKELLGIGPEGDFSNLKNIILNFGLHQLFAAKFRNDSKSKGEFVAKTVSGKILQMRWNALVDGDKKYCGTVIVLRDTTAQVELDKAQTEFIAAISHELRTPLTTMQNYISNMLAGIAGKLNPKMCSYLTSMREDCYRLTRLINDLLDMAKLEAGKMPILRSVTNLVDIGSKAVEAFSSIAAQKNITVELSKTGPVCRAYVDSQRIYQVFSNLINNAIQYTNKSGHIRVSIFERNNEIISVVEDTGIGIPADRHRHIFNKFYQISRQAGAGYKGSGLGLSLCNEIIAVHGGKMWLESQLGVGSKFYFSLPIIKPEIILNKHLENLASRASKNGDRFALMTLRLETANSSTDQNKQVIESIMNKIVHTADEIAAGNGELIVRLENCRAAIVLGQTGKRYIAHIKKKLRNIIDDALLEHGCSYDSVLPMVGTAVFPNDAANVELLKNKAATQVNKL